MLGQCWSIRLFGVVGFLGCRLSAIGCRRLAFVTGRRRSAWQAGRAACRWCKRRPRRRNRGASTASRRARRCVRPCMTASRQAAACGGVAGAGRFAPGTGRKSTDRPAGRIGRLRRKGLWPDGASLHHSSNFRCSTVGSSFRGPTGRLRLRRRLAYPIAIGPRSACRSTSWRR